MGNKTFTDVAKPNEIVQLLLNDDQLANLEANGGTSSKSIGKRPAGADSGVDLWNEEGDEFFRAQPNQGGAANDGDDDAPPVVTSTRGRKRGGRGGGDGTPRGRGRGGRGRKKAVAADMDS